MSFIDSLMGDSAAEVSAATGTGNTSFWGGLVDDFSTIADAAIKYEKAKNPASEGVAQTVQVATTSESVDPNPEQQTATADQFANAYAVSMGGKSFKIDKKFVYIGGAVVAGLLLFKVAK